MSEQSKTPHIATIGPLNSGKAHGSSILGYTGQPAAATPFYESILENLQAVDRAFAEAERDIKAFKRGNR